MKSVRIPASDCRARRKNLPQSGIPPIFKQGLIRHNGDCGVLWPGGRRDEIQLALLEDLPFTIAFVDGNHENFTALSKYPIEEWNGGKVQFLRPHVIHLMRGQIFTLERHTFFTMGGASSHDVGDGILDPASPDYCERLLHLLGEGRRQYRIVGQSWWPEELPSEEEYAEARRNLDVHGWTVDYIITHSPPSGLAERLDRPRDELTDFLEEIRQKASYRSWICSATAIGTRRLMKSTCFYGNRSCG